MNSEVLGHSHKFYQCFLLLTLTILVCSCTINPTEKVDLLIYNATIIDVREDTLLPDKMVAINGNKISAVDKSANRDQYQAASVINAKGRYLMPGLWDMHVHFRGGDDLISENKNFLPLFLAFGVTTVRDAGGDMTPSLMKWKQQISQRELAGPTIFTSGPKLDSYSALGFIRVEGQNDIKPALDSLESIGVDYVKLYDFGLTKELYYGIIKEAEKRRLKITGHMPLSVDMLQAVKYGLDGIEHLQYLLSPASLLADSLNINSPGLNRFFPHLESFDPVLATEAYHSLAKQNLYVTSTLYYLTNIGRIYQKDHSTDTLLSYIGPRIQHSYQSSVKLTKSNGEQYLREIAQMTARLNKMVEPVHKAGINLLAGTDSGPSSPYVYPGQSLHEELRILVEAGLTPAQALRSSVINGPKFFDQLDSYGSVEKGKVADLLLLRKNPLQNINHTTSIRSVMVRGRFYTQNELSMLLSNIKN